MIAALTAWVASLAALFGLALPADAAGMESAPGLTVHVYDVPHNGQRSEHTTTEHGPALAAYNILTTYDAVDRWSHDSGRQNTATPWATSTYDHPTMLSQVVGVAATHEEAAASQRTPLSSVARGGVAANAAPKLAGVPKLAGGSLQEVGGPIWAHGNPASLLGTRSPEVLRGLASRSDAVKLRDFYQAAADAGRGGTTTPIRVRLAQEIIDAWD